MRKLELRSIDLTTFPLQPQRWAFVLAAILAQRNFGHAVKNKGVSHATMEDRRRFLFRTFDFLRHNREKSFKFDPRSLSGRHVEFLFKHWEKRSQEGSLGPSSLQKFHSYLTTFAKWIGKPDLVKPLRAYIGDAKLYSRTYVATESKAWRARGIDAGKVIDDIAAFDEHVAVQVDMLRCFGMRCKEAVMFRPRSDVVTAAQAGKTSAEVTHYLKLRRGTKGGRERFIPIDTPERKEAIERACRLALRDDESISNPRYTLVQACRHLRYVMERIGITKRGLGVTPHGLRHQYAADEYKVATGEAPPVEGGSRVPRVVAVPARADVSEKLGHSRFQITNAYLGSEEQPFDHSQKE
jgi:integrase